VIVKAVSNSRFGVFLHAHVGSMADAGIAFTRQAFSPLERPYGCLSDAAGLIVDELLARLVSGDMSKSRSQWDRIQMCAKGHVRRGRTRPVHVRIVWIEWCDCDCGCIVVRS